MEARFQDTRSTGDKITKLLRLRQNKGESVQNYIKRFLSACAETVLGGTSEQEKENQKISIFIQSLVPKLKNELSKNIQFFTSFAQVENQVIRLQEIYGTNGSFIENQDHEEIMIMKNSPNNKNKPQRGYTNEDLSKRIRNDNYNEKSQPPMAQNPHWKNNDGNYKHTYDEQPFPEHQITVQTENHRHGYNQNHKYQNRTVCNPCNNCPKCRHNRTITYRYSPQNQTHQHQYLQKSYHTNPPRLISQYRPHTNYQVRQPETRFVSPKNNYGTFEKTAKNVRYYSNKLGQTTKPQESSINVIHEELITTPDSTLCDSNKGMTMDGQQMEDECMYQYDHQHGFIQELPIDVLNIEQFENPDISKLEIIEITDDSELPKNGVRA